MVNAGGQLVEAIVPPDSKAGDKIMVKAPKSAPTVIVSAVIVGDPTVQASVVQTQPPVVLQGQYQQAAPSLPYGAPPGGHFTEERYCGAQTAVISICLLFLFWPAAW